MFIRRVLMPPQPVATKAQPKLKPPTSTKTQPKWQKATQSSPPQSVLPNQSEPADAPEQTIDPSDQGTSSTVVPETMTIASTQGIILAIQEIITDELVKKLSSFLALTDFTTKDIPWADPADPPQDTIKITSSSQRQEIVLKQVSYLT
jgi:hypothetical protein